MTTQQQASMDKIAADIQRVGDEIEDAVKRRRSMDMYIGIKREQYAELVYRQGRYVAMLRKVLDAEHHARPEDIA